MSEELVRGQVRARSVQPVAGGDRGGRPVELALGTLLLAVLGGYAAFAGAVVMNAGPMAAVATVLGVLVVVLAWGTWLGSRWVRNTLLVVVALAVLLLLVRQPHWPVAVLAVAAVLVAGTPRTRAWFR